MKCTGLYASASTSIDTLYAFVFDTATYYFYFSTIDLSAGTYTPTNLKSFSEIGSATMMHGLITSSTTGYYIAST